MALLRVDLLANRLRFLHGQQLNMDAQLAQLGIRRQADGTFHVTFKRQPRRLMGSAAQQYELYFRSIKAGERPAMQELHARYKSTDELVRGFGHVLDSYLPELARLVQLRQDLRHLNSLLARPGVTSRSRAVSVVSNRIAKVMEELSGRRDFQLRASLEQLRKAQSLLEKKNVSAACASLVGAVNRTLGRQLVSQNVIVPHVRRRLAAVLELQRFEDELPGKLGASLDALHATLGTSVVIAHRTGNPRGSLPEGMRLNLDKSLYFMQELSKRLHPDFHAPWTAHLQQARDNVLRPRGNLDVAHQGLRQAREHLASWQEHKI